MSMEMLLIICKNIFKDMYIASGFFVFLFCLVALGGFGGFFFLFLEGRGGCERKTSTCIYMLMCQNIKLRQWWQKNLGVYVARCRRLRRIWHTVLSRQRETNIRVHLWPPENQYDTCVKFIVYFLLNPCHTCMCCIRVLIKYIIQLFYNLY